MENYIFKQLRFVRNNTMKQVEGLSDEMSHLIPEGFNNNIKWNLGHILVVQEKFPLQLIGEEMKIPKTFAEIFGPGTKPVNWGERVPSIDEIIQLLTSQISRIEQTVGSRLEESFEKPFVTSAGLELVTVEQSLSFCLYHEGMHFNAMKSIKRRL
jgi:uncharacterized damage-inducible protein DinB